MKLALLAIALAACSPPSGGGTTRLTSDGSSIAVDGEVPLRGLVIDLTWQTGDEGVEVTELIPGAGATRLDIFAHDLGAAPGRARVVISDTRQVKLPARGEVLRVTATGPVRITAAQAAADGPEPVEVELP